MKRSKYLETLSWEHHDGLVAVNRLKKGLQKNVPPEMMRDFILHIWEDELSHHFWQEEETLIQPLQKNDDTRQLLQHMLDDHQIFRSFIAGLKKSPSPQSASIKVFSDKLNEHIRFEERQLFPAVEKHLPTESLEKIGRFLHEQHHPGKKEWEPEFWK